MGWMNILAQDMGWIKRSFAQTRPHARSISKTVILTTGSTRIEKVPGKKYQDPNIFIMEVLGPGPIPINKRLRNGRRIHLGRFSGPGDHSRPIWGHFGDFGRTPYFNICLVSAADICPVSAADMCPVSKADISPVSIEDIHPCLLYTSPSPRDRQKSRMPSSA